MNAYNKDSRAIAAMKNAAEETIKTLPLDSQDFARSLIHPALYCEREEYCNIYDHIKFKEYGLAAGIFRSDEDEMEIVSFVPDYKFSKSEIVYVDPRLEYKYLKIRAEHLTETQIDFLCSSGIISSKKTGFVKSKHRDSSGRP